MDGLAMEHVEKHVTPVEQKTILPENSSGEMSVSYSDDGVVIETGDHCQGEVMSVSMNNCNGNSLQEDAGMADKITADNRVDPADSVCSDVRQRDVLTWSHVKEVADVLNAASDECVLSSGVENDSVRKVPAIVLVEVNATDVNDVASPGNNEIPKTLGSISTVEGSDGHVSTGDEVSDDIVTTSCMPQDVIQTDSATGVVDCMREGFVPQCNSTTLISLTTAKSTEGDVEGNNTAGIVNDSAHKDNQLLDVASVLDGIDENIVENVRNVHIDSDFIATEETSGDSVLELSLADTSVKTSYTIGAVDIMELSGTDVSIDLDNAVQSSDVIASSITDIARDIANQSFEAIKLSVTDTSCATHGDTQSRDILELSVTDISNSAQDIAECGDVIEPSITKAGDSQSEDQGNDVTTSSVSDWLHDSQDVTEPSASAELRDVPHTAMPSSSDLNGVENSCVTAELPVSSTSADSQEASADSCYGSSLKSEEDAISATESEKLLEKLCASIKEPEETEHLSKCELLAHDHTLSTQSAAGLSAEHHGHALDSCKSKSDDWAYVLGNEQLKKRIVKPGIDNARPEHGQLVTVRCCGRLDDGTEIDRHDSLKIVLGDGDFVHAFDLCIPLMFKGEIAQIVTDARFAYGTLGRNPDVPSNASVTYEIEILDYEDQPKFSTLPISERVRLSNEKRERGNYLYARSECSRAIDIYLKAISIAADDQLSHTESPAELQSLLDTRVKCYNNLAAAQLKIEAWDAAIKSSDQVLRVQPENVKALFRKGKCLANMGDYDAAILVLRRALKLEPGTKIIQQELARLEKKSQEQTRSQKQMYQKMLGTSKDLASVDSKKQKKKKDEYASTSWKWYTAAAVGILFVSAAVTAYRRFGHI